MADTSGKSRVAAPIRSKDMNVNQENSTPSNLKPLLSGEEEISLAVIIQAGLKAKENPRAKGNKKLIKDGEAAENHFVESNLRLAHYVARQYVNRGVEYDDLVQEATLGLMHAISKFDSLLTLCLGLSNTLLAQLVTTVAVFDYRSIKSRRSINFAQFTIS